MEWSQQTGLKASIVASRRVLRKINWEENDRDIKLWEENSMLRSENELTVWETFKEIEKWGWKFEWETGVKNDSEEY